MIDSSPVSKTRNPSLRCARGLVGGLAALALIVGAASPAAAIDWPDWKWPEWEESKAEDVTAKALDVVMVRPLALLRTAVGAVLFLPAALFSLPGDLVDLAGSEEASMEGVSEAYDLLIAAPLDYAIDRQLGDL